MKAKNIAGQRFGYLTALSMVGSNAKGAAMWLCECDCGNKKIVSGSKLREGVVKSCGCMSKKLIAISSGREAHGHSDDRLYNVWRTMKARCDNPNNEKYPNYGGRGIKVCDEWHESFTEFRKWALKNGYDYEAPYGKCTLDRIDVDGNYEPLNCRWVDATVQANNQRPRRQIVVGIEVDYRGRHYFSLAELARDYGFDSAMLERRIHHMSIDDAMDEILNSNRHPRKWTECEYELAKDASRSNKELSIMLNRSVDSVRKMRRKLKAKFNSIEVES